MIARRTYNRQHNCKLYLQEHSTLCLSLRIAPANVATFVASAEHRKVKLTRCPAGAGLYDSRVLLEYHMWRYSADIDDTSTLVAFPKLLKLLGVQAAVTVGCCSGLHAGCSLRVFGWDLVMHGGVRHGNGAGATQPVSALDACSVGAATSGCCKRDAECGPRLFPTLCTKQCSNNVQTRHAHAHAHAPSRPRNSSRVYALTLNISAATWAIM